VYQRNINFTGIDHFYADFYINSDAVPDVSAYISIRVNGDIVYERKIGQKETILLSDNLIDVSAYGDYCTLEFRLNQTAIFYDEGIFAYIDNIRMKIWHTLDTWNLTLGNMSISPYTLDTWNITIGNMSVSPYTLDTWNITIGNMSVSPYTLDTWNITLGNMSIASFTIDTWNITLSNTPSPYTLDTWNVTLSNTTLPYVLDTWNVTFSNTSLFIIANITATPSTGTVNSTIINITCNVTSTNAIVNVTVNMTGGTYDMSNISDLYYYASTYNIVGIHYYHIYANDTSGDQLESSVYSFEITGLSCSFTYVVKGSVVTVTPTIVSSTYYKWTVEHSSETEWIPIADIGDHKFVFPYGGKHRIILIAKNETASVDYSRLITAKASFVEPEPDEEIPEKEEKPKLRNVYTDTGISDWVEDRNIGEFILIGVIVLFALLAIFKRRPKKLVIYPIKKEEK
jgi:hypothetical protein